MIKKKILIFLIILLSHCGFTPIYNNSNQNNYKINIIEINGDRNINNTIVSEIKRTSNNEAKKIFNIKINSVYSKSIISKNLKGNASDYQVNAVANIDINYNNKSKKVSYKERQNIENISDFFDLRFQRKLDFSLI